MPDLYEVRNNEVEEVMNEIPHWVTRWGISSVFVIFIILVIIATYIQYPDTIQVQGTLKVNQTSTLVNGDKDAYVEVILEQVYFSEVKTGSKVRFHFLSFAPQEYGELTGVIEHIDENIDSQSKGHLVDVKIPLNGITSKNKKINYSDGLMVKGKIILKETNLLNKLVNNIKI